MLNRFVQLEIGKASLLTEEIGPIPDDCSLIKIAACGMCGTDEHLFEGMVLPRGATYPIRPGHEVSGTVVVSNSLPEGQTVLVHPIIPCETCAECLAGVENLCRNQSILGIHGVGGMADLLIWPTRRLVAFSTQSILSAAIIPDAVTTAYHATTKVDLHSVLSVCVIGAGGVGTNILRLARIINPTLDLLGVVNSQGSSERLKSENFSSLIGLDSLAKRVKLLYSSFDVVFDFSGDARAPAEALKILRKGGTFVLGGINDSPLTLNLSTSAFVTRGISVIGSYTSNINDLRNVVDLVQSNNLNFDDAVTHKFPLSEYNAAYETLTTRPTGLGRILLVP